ncbi:MAG TPA: hypothetical protein VGL39_18640 [Jatrophihabitantaceae bacterium]|jgi:hypothetical protein
MSGQFEYATSWSAFTGRGVVVGPGSLIPRRSPDDVPTATPSAASEPATTTNVPTRNQIRIPQQRHEDDPALSAWAGTW